MKQVLIFGATSAIAAEVAELHAARGDGLHLVARNAEKLAQLAERCRNAAPTTQQADFSDVDTNAEVVRSALSARPHFDRVLIAHGDLGDQLATERSFVDAEQTLRVNFLSVVSLLIPLANHFEAQRSGEIGVITSVAGDRGRPRNYTYGTAKGALNIYLQGLRSRLYSSGVTITTVKLGPVDTPMTVDHAKHALFGQPDRVAKDIVRAMDKHRAEVYVPWFWSLIMRVVRSTPEQIFQRLSFLSGR